MSIVTNDTKSNRVASKSGTGDPYKKILSIWFFYLNEVNIGKLN